MKKLIVSCPSCKAKYDVGRYDPGTKFKCKKCDKSLIVPDGGPEEVAAAPVERGSKRGGGRKRGGTRGPRSRGRKGATRRRDRDLDDEYDDERPFPTAKKGPNLPLILGIGAGMLVLIIAGVAFMMSKESANQEAYERDMKKRKAREKLEDSAPPPVEPEKKDESHVKKPKPKPKEKDTGEFVKETYAEDDKRTQDEKADWKTKVSRHNLKKKIFDVDGSVKAQAEDILKKIEQNIDDPPLVDKCTDDLENLGKKVFPAVLNALTKQNHKSKVGMDIATQLYRFCERMSSKWWGYEGEYRYGAFESHKEKWAAIVEMKELWAKHEKD